MTYFSHRGVAMPLSAAEEARVAGTYAGGETIRAAPGPSSLSGEGGGDILIGNNFDNRHWITDPKDEVVEQVGGGIDTEIGWTSIKLAANVENLQVNGAFNYAVGNNLDNLIIVDNETHWIYGAGGDDVLVGGATSSNTFVVRAGEGSDVIYNWNGNSHLQLLGYGFGSGDQLRAAMSQVGADVVLKLSATETLTFRGATPAAFTDRQFLLPLDVSKLGAMTFADEFNTLQVYDPSTQTGQWNTSFGGDLKDPWAYTLPSNGERQVYTTPGFYGQGEEALGFNALSTAGGVLTIKAERIAQDDRDAAWGREYSSGMINTLGVFEQKYGYFEMRAELPTAVGTWPAFWMMPTPYAAQVEADIMEGLAATPNVDYRRAWGGAENLYDNAYAIDPAGYHTYGMLWTPTNVTFYYDGVAVLQAATPANWTVPMGMIINMAVGGWGGEPDEHAYPAQMHVDYVHAYALAGGGTVVETAEPVVPAATLRADGGPTQGLNNAPMVFAVGGQAVTSAHIAVYDDKPATPPAGRAFVIWEDAGAVFGAVTNGATPATGTALMAGDSRVFTGAGSWLSDGKVVIGYMKASADGVGQSAWAMVFDPAAKTFTRHELGASTGDIDFVATANGGFAASWDGPDGHVYGRGYDAFVYDGEGWYGPTRQLTGDLTGRTATGELIATDAAGHQQLYDLINPPRPISAIISVGPMAGVTHSEGDAGRTLYTFTLIRDWDQTEKSTVAWNVRGQGASPTDGADFVDGVAPSGVVTFEINQTTAFVQVWIKGDTLVEDDESFLITLSDPVRAKLGQATATGFVVGDDTAPPAPPVIGLTTSSVSHAEGGSGSTAYSYVVTRSGSTAGASSVAWSVAGAGASPADAADFIGGALPGGVLKFSAGETSKTIVVNVVGDATFEADEGFTLTLTGSADATLGATTATGLITNDDTAPVVPTAQVLVSGGYGVTLTGGAGADTLIAGQGPDVLAGGGGGDRFVFNQAPWNAGRITDFAVGTDRLDLSALLATGGTGDPVADGRIILRGDGADTQVLFDSDGPLAGNPWPITITTLAGVSASGLTWLQLTGGALPPAAPPSLPVVGLSTDVVTHAEGASGPTAYSYGVTRAGSTTAASSVSWSLAGSGAAPAGGADFIGGALPAGTLTFAAGETRKTITINVAGDGLVEANEGFTLTLSGPTGASLGTTTASGLITNDDNAPTSGGAGLVITSSGYGVTLTGGVADDTLIAGRGSDVLTGGGGADRFVFNDAPWNAGKVTDFTPGNDVLDLRGLFAKTSYAGSDPVADHWLEFRAEGQGGVQVYLDMDGGGGEWPTLVSTLEHLTPSQVSASDWLFR